MVPTPLRQPIGHAIQLLILLWSITALASIISNTGSHSGLPVTSDSATVKNLVKVSHIP